MRSLTSAALLLGVLAAAPGVAGARPPRLADETTLATDPTAADPTSLPLIEHDRVTGEMDPPPAPVPAHADRDLWGRWRLAGGVGVRFGNFRVDGHGTGTAIPFHLDAGVRNDRLFLYASYDVLGIDLDLPAPLDLPEGAPVSARGATSSAVGDGNGLVQRLGANVQYALGRVGERDGGFQVWVEAGAGVQHIAWDAGGVWNRPDLALGVGGTMLGLARHAHGGFSLGLRVMLAPRSDVAGAPAACGGPCDHPTPPAGWDRSFLFDMTVPFGR